eukprot:gene3893-3791_t
MGSCSLLYSDGTAPDPCPVHPGAPPNPAASWRGRRDDSASRALTARLPVTGVDD